MYKLTFYMKSGNSFVVDGIKEWKVESRGGPVSYLCIKYAENMNKRLILPSIQLGQVEAIFQEEY